MSLDQGISRTKAKGIAICLFALFSAASAIAPDLAVTASVHEGLRIGLLVLASCAIFAWFRADAKSRDYRPSPILNVAVFGLAAFALPYYFVRSRGWKRGALALIAAIGIFLATSVFAGLCAALFAYLR